MSRAFSLYLDLIRFLSALLVMLFHANWIYEPDLVITSLGHEAVVIFFVLSGFVIAYVVATREPDFRSFMVARAARIFSVAIPAIILTAVLDASGFFIDPDVYPEGYRAWGMPLVRMVSSSLFLNEIWTLGIQLFTNVPYWSLNYEVWYYVVFGVLHFFEGRRRWIAFLVICLFLGPKILLLMPVWWFGVWVYRSPTLAQLSNGKAWACLLASLLGAYVYVAFEVGQMGHDYLEQLFGDALFTQLSFSRQFISDYYLGLVLALHFAGLRILLVQAPAVPARISSSIRYMAGATFSIYLFHQPLLWFFSAVFSGVEEGLPRYLVVVPLTLAAAMFFAIFTEHKKQAWNNGIEHLLALGERGVMRLRRSQAG